MHRIAGGRVEAGADDDELRPVLLERRQDDPLERSAIQAVAAAGGERHVDGVSLAIALAALRGVAGPRIERELVGRHVEDVGVGVEHLLGAVAVMHVPVDDRDAVESARARVRRRDGRVVEEAEAHRLVRAGVVSRRSHESDAALHRPVEDGVRERDGSAGGELGDGDALGAHVRVGIDVPVLAAELEHRLQEARIVHATELFFGCGAGFDRSKPEASHASGPLDRCMRCVEAFGAFRVVGGRAMLEKPRV